MKKRTDGVFADERPLPEGCLTYLEVLDEEYWALAGEAASAETVALRRAYRDTRNLPDLDALKNLPLNDTTTALRQQALRKLEAEQSYQRSILQRLHAAKRSALTFSGGGIRSATFGLGILQGLASRSVAGNGSAPTLLGELDYLSTVSGGGYLGSWFSAWSKRAGGASKVIENLADIPDTIFEPEAKPVQYLRRFGSYLNPKLGFLSADTWTLAATVLRNMFLNWLVMLPMLAAVLLGPVIAYQLAATPAGEAGAKTLAVLLLTGFAAGVLGTGYVGFDLPSAGNARLGQGSYLLLCLGPLAISASVLNVFWAWLPAEGLPSALLPIRVGKNHLDMWHFLLFGGIMHGGGMLGGAVIAWIIHRRPPLFKGVKATFVAAATGVVGGMVAYWLTRILHVDQTGAITDPKLYTCVAFPLLMSVFILSGALLVGGTSYITEDEDREWWARSGGWLVLPTLIWPVASAIVLYCGPWLDLLETHLTAAFTGATGLTGWAAASLGASSGTPSGRRDDTSGMPKLPMTSKVKQILAELALPAFLILLVMTVALVNAAMLRTGSQLLPSFEDSWLFWRQTGPVWILLLFHVLWCATASYFINVNKFSLHAMYRLRLIRAYLGASNTARNPHPFTGFDRKDNIQMCELNPSRPMHIVNMALNLVKGENLAWQERKAAPFTSTRLHTGSCRVGYRPSSIYGGKYDDTKEPITLGTAITISGAAASPNMGYNSSPLLTIVMMLFNARLGWWLGNPRDPSDSWKKPGPTFGVRPFIDETFGLTTDTNAWVYLSDGGHFDNLGLYEAVLRRCHTIIVSDAGADPHYTYEDLGNAVRKIQIDLGIPIVFDALSGGAGMPMSPTRKKTEEHNGRHCATARIRYCVVDGEGVDDGILIYLKPSMDGDEPADVRQYSAANRDFPHESTADQFFEEAQFESYRRLGFHVIETICAFKSDPRTLEDFVKAAKTYAAGI